MVRSALTAASGRSLDDGDDLAVEVTERLRQLRNQTVGGRVPLASIRSALAGERPLGEDPWANEALIAAAVADLDTLIASGGACAPAQPLYDVEQIATAATPVRDALPRVDAARGRIAYLPTRPVPGQHRGEPPHPRR